MHHRSSVKELRQYIPALAAMIEVSHEKVRNIRSKAEDVRAEHRRIDEARTRQLESTLIEVEKLRDSQADMMSYIAASRQDMADLSAEVGQKVTHVRMQARALGTLWTRQVAPEGKMAMVFTDVKSSTDQWEQFPGEMRRALLMHNQIMRKEILEVGGYEVTTEGDAFQVAFQEAAQAVRFCVAVQRRMLKADWPFRLLSHPASAELADEDGRMIFRGLRVRMGIHYSAMDSTVEPSTNRRRYFGAAINRASRIEGAADGGQIIASAAVVRAIQPIILDEMGAQVTELGRFRLRGLDSAETLVSILHNDFDTRTFAPIVAERVRPAGVVGRSKMISVLRASTSDSLARLQDIEGNMKQSMMSAQRVTSLMGQLLQEFESDVNALLKRTTDDVTKATDRQRETTELLAACTRRRDECARRVSALSDKFASMSSQFDSIPVLEEEIAELIGGNRVRMKAALDERREYMETLQDVAMQLSHFKDLSHETDTIMEQIQEWTSAKVKRMVHQRSNEV